MSDTRFIIAGSFIDGNGTDVRKNLFLAVHDGIITSIDSVAQLPRNNVSAIDDFSHCILLPALVDCSVSLSRSPAMDSRVRLASEESSLAKSNIMLQQHIRDCHTHGVLGVADSDDATNLVEDYKKITKPENIIEIRTSGHLCRIMKDDTTKNSAGGNFLKIGYSCNIEDKNIPSPCLRPEDLYNILQRTGKKKTVVVANGVQQVKEALKAGCDAIEQGYAMGEDNLKIMAKNNILWIPSVLRAKNALDGTNTGGDVCCRFSQRYVAPGKPVPGAEAFWKKKLTEQLKQLRLAKNLGVTTAVGTGAGSVGILHGESMVEEMKLFIKAGYSLEQTIQCASKNGTKFFNMEKLGTLTVGRQATFLIARGTAQQLPRKLSYLENIYVNGVPSTAYNKNPTQKS